MLRKSFGISALIAAFSLASVDCAQAVVLQIDPSQSSLTLTSASALFGGAPATIQPGGEATSLSGSLVASVSNSTLELLPGSVFTADDEGSFLPGIPDGPDFFGDNVDPEPASFAFTYPTASVPQVGIDIDVALRGLTFSIDDIGPRSLVGGVLGAGTPDFAIVDGEGHLNAGQPAISDLTVFSAMTLPSAAGSFALNGNLLTITLPVEIQVDEPGGIFSQSVYSGVIVASGVVPEPATGLLVGLSIAGGVSVMRRRG